MELYQYARKMGDNDAAFSLASINDSPELHNHLISSGGVEKDPEYSKKELYALSKKGHPYAQLNYATILIKEDPVKYKAQIEELLTLACKYGLARAHLKLGELYKNGKVLDKNFELAKKHLELAVSKDMHEAIFLLGDMYSKGEGLVNNQPDYAQAFEHFKDAASKGVVEAQYNLGVYYLNGFGVEKNVDLAVEYWEMASMQGFPLAALNLAKLYMEGLQADSESKANPDGTTTINPSKRIGFKAPLFEKDYVKAKNYIYAAKSLGKGTFIEQDANNLLQKLAVRSGDSKIPTERIARAGTATDINANANVNTKGNTNSSISATRASKGYKVVEKKSSGGKCSVM
ncbi:Protein sel-1-like protein [Zancudomyces culisetae]|uniref:Protein sel-1-like protein n=1 Tax=Zancudomyces culisetae TaxID=1213189 RepID=A0A1R1PBX1_ZANCU|nr:Protein sel-1-like protein [Zancudomyces culisetae]|eukprot:OMH78453.1 Protein sel-1-like protein [Zancudomyces culisetae]